ncbi:SCO family protein [Nocardioides panaciterrulae]|nr:SCO family protein [Nocardioides panaciterrulae]
MLLAAILVLGLASCSAKEGAPAAAAGAMPDAGTSLDAPVPASVLTAPLTDSRGRPTTLDAFRGKVLVLTDVMTLCQESCPIVTASMVTAARRLEASLRGDRVQFLSLTVDPGRDDVRHLRAYERQFGALPNWTLLTGSRRVVDGLWDTLGVWRHRTPIERPFPRDWVTGVPLTTDIAHTDELIFIDGDQRFRYEMDGYGNVPASAIPGRIYRFMDRLGHRNVSATDPGAWTPDQVTEVVDWLLGGAS